MNTNEHANIRGRRINIANNTAIEYIYAKKNYFSNACVGVVILVLVVRLVMNRLCRTNRISYEMRISLIMNITNVSAMSLKLIGLAVLMLIVLFK